MEEVHAELDQLCPTKSQPQEAWTWLVFGLGPSPHGAIKHALHTKEFAIDNHRESGSPVRWDMIALNLLGMKTFDPRLPWVHKWDSERGCVSRATIMCVEDGHGT